MSITFVGATSVISTEDPLVVIVDQEPGRVRYRDLTTGSEWVVLGTCDRCGVCEVGALGRNLRWDGPVGSPGACVDLDYGSRLDIPMRPPFRFRCSLRGE